MKWTDNKFAITKGLYNGCTCNFMKKLNSVEFIVYIANYNAFLKQNRLVSTYLFYCNFSAPTLKHLTFYSLMCF